MADVTLRVIEILCECGAEFVIDLHGSKFFMCPQCHEVYQVTGKPKLKKVSVEKGTVE